MNAAAGDTGRARYFRLQTLARRRGRDTQELLTLYALEGLLARLAASEHSQSLVLKGGMLLAAFGQRRPTRDLDVQARQLPNDIEVVRQLIVEIAEIDLGDGLRLDTAGATAEPIRDLDEYGVWVPETRSWGHSAFLYSLMGLPQRGSRITSAVGEELPDGRCAGASAAGCRA